MDDPYELRYLTNLDRGSGMTPTSMDSPMAGNTGWEPTPATHSRFPRGIRCCRSAIEFYFAGDMLVIEWEGSEDADYAISIADDVNNFIPSPQAPEQPFPGIPFYRWTIEKPDPEGLPARWFFRVETTLKP